VTRAPSSSVGLGVRAGRGAGRTGPTPYARAVLDVVDRIPPGKVMTYGDVAELMGRGSPRTVGAVLSEHGREVPWQRVVQASGRPAEPYLHEALALLTDEGCPVSGERVDLAAARWDGQDGGG
jgi:alkylated DNA nucleotide flippase Atl1